MVLKIHNAWKKCTSKTNIGQNYLEHIAAATPSTCNHSLCQGCSLAPTVEQSEFLNIINTAAPADTIQWDSIPAMPTVVRTTQQQHRTKIPTYNRIWDCAVARPVGKKEIEKEADARKALQK